MRFVVATARCYELHTQGGDVLRVQVALLRVVGGESLVYIKNSALTACKVLLFNNCNFFVFDSVPALVVKAFNDVMPNVWNLIGNKRRW